MISKKLQKALNDQMNFEFHSAHIYLQMAAYATAKGYDGVANFFLVQEKEERTHGMKFYNFLAQCDVEIEITGFDMAPVAYERIIDIYRAALAHEKIVTERIYDIADIAQEEREHATSQLLSWFINEQVEEMANFNKQIHTLEHIDEETNDMLVFDQAMAARTFVDTTGVV